MVGLTLASIPLHCVAVLSYLRCDAARARTASKRARSISGRASGVVVHARGVTTLMRVRHCGVVCKRSATVRPRLHCATVRGRARATCDFACRARA
eukprot:4095115-Lingulodinium_polyedra.AAC.1